MPMRWIRLAMILVGWPGLALLSPTAQASNFPPEHFNPPKQFYLALGDSAAFGAQLGKFFQELSTASYDPASFDTGYVDGLSAQLRSIDPKIQTVNLSCPAESTGSFTNVCPFKALGFALHTNYTGSQESAALSFLREHRGQVSPITIDIGLADALFPCAGPTFLVDVACVHKSMPTALQSVARNLPKILADLQRASPSSEIIMMTYYNPFFVEDTSTDALITSLNDEIAAVAITHRVRVADAFELFNRSENEAANICALTLMCPGHDYHPSDAGYTLIAKQFWTASDYGRLAD
jgi:lysophospholipase L1-like esterase